MIEAQQRARAPPIPDLPIFADDASEILSHSPDFS